MCEKMYKVLRLPKHKYSGKMSQVSVVEPLGVFDLDPASNHGVYHRIKPDFNLCCSDLIAVAKTMNSYAPDQPGGGKMKILANGDQGGERRIIV